MDLFAGLLRPLIVGVKYPKEQAMAEIQLEAGITSGNCVFIGVPPECYDEIIKPISGKTLHVFVLTVKQAEVVIEMLQVEISRTKDNKSDG